MNNPENELSAEDRVIADALVAARPAPETTFRSALGSSLAEADPGYGHRPPRLWRRAGVLAGAGALLVLLGLLVSTGAI
jgi:hypothetical protein